MSARDKLKRRPASAAVQTARILDALRRQKWVSGADFRSPTIDGGPEIRNVTPRVSDLRRVHGIASERGDVKRAAELRRNLEEAGWLLPSRITSKPCRPTADTEADDHG